MATETKIGLLDSAINEVSDPSESQCELLREHLESARASLLGQMGEECSLTLHLASQTLNCIANAERRRRVSRLIDELLSAKD